MAYKHVIRAKTKNLFNISNADIISKDYYFTLNQGEGSNFYVMTVKPGITYTVSFEMLVKSNDVPATNALGLSIQTGTHYKDGTQLLIILGNEKRGVWVKRSKQFTVPSGITQVTFSGLWNRFLYRNFMIQEGSTPTPYTPYNYLQSNKRMIKVSDVCQLLDKSKFPATTTLNGVTFTNNGNNVITTTGNASNLGSWLNMFYSNFNITKTHKYLLCGSPAGGSSNTYFMRLIPRIDGDPKDTGEGVIFSAMETAEKYVTLQTLPGSGDNLVWKPQLFDLTEMFGAGHEPATVAEFRQRFPNEYYPYSPQCWLTSYKSAVVCKTKNLFDYKTTSTNNLIDWQNVKLSLHEDYIELSGTQQPDKVIELGWDGFNIPFEVGKTYTLSADTKIPGFASMFMSAHYTDGQSPSNIWEAISWNLSQGTVRKIFTPTRPGYFDRLTFYNPLKNHFSGDYIFRVQLEQGSTATSYVPYQHL